ncbi:MAG: flagellar hook-basal body protein [Lachnospiraceae bacterium]|nr:flagellar hook-basal body protein [Lachnospiraceae bacterium]
MVKGLYTAYTGMVNEQNRMDVLTNNLANFNTTGFKKEGSVASAFSDKLALRIKDEADAKLRDKLGIVNLGVKTSGTYVDFSQGPMKNTDLPTDLAIQGKGFFNIEHTDHSGNTTVMYSRDGNFAVTVNGELTTQDGDFVLDRNGGHVIIDPTQDFQIAGDGSIFQNGRLVDAIGFTDFRQDGPDLEGDSVVDHYYNSLVHYGENLFMRTEQAVEIEPQLTVVQGYLEQSNVSTVDEMVQMIASQRQYDSNQKVITTIDATLEIAVQQLGRLQ